MFPQVGFGRLLRLFLSICDTYEMGVWCARLFRFFKFRYRCYSQIANRPLILLGHSLGGLIIKQVCI